MDQPVTFAGAGEQEQRQEMERHNETQAAPGAENLFPRASRLKNQQQRLKHPAEVLAAGPKADN